jgi:hypothetical protein
MEQVIQAPETFIYHGYLTDNHEFDISFNNTVAIIRCKYEYEAEATENPVTLEEFKIMIETASIKGIKQIKFNCNYSIQVHSHQWKEIAKKFKVKITRISQ